MGKQVRFYMLPEDERTFLRSVCRDQAVVLLADSSPEPKLQILENLLTSLQQRSELSTILLWNTALPIKETDIREVRLREYKEELGAYIETGKVIYSVDRLNAPVIEFSPSFIRRDGQLVRGRIWAEMYRQEGGTLVHKGADFESWYDRIARWLRRNFKRAEGIDGYFGPQALEWYQEGGKLSK
ncbi:MAG: hypothetical protein ACETWR_06450 [Anaerolineae bacterium]